MSLQLSRRSRAKSLFPAGASRRRLDEMLVLAGATTALVFTLGIVFGFIAG